MNEVSFCPKTIRKQNIDEILYNTYSTGGWNPDYEQIPIQRRLKFMNNVVRAVIKNPEIAKNDPTYSRIFESCVANVRKQCKKIPSEKIEPFCKRYTTNVLKLDEKYVPRVMASLFNIGELKESFDSEIESAHNSVKAMRISLNENPQAARAILGQYTIKPNSEISDSVRRNASINAYKQTG